MFEMALHQDGHMPPAYVQLNYGDQLFLQDVILYKQQQHTHAAGSLLSPHQSKQGRLEGAGLTRANRGSKNSIPNNHMKAHNYLYSYSVLIYIK